MSDDFHMEISIPADNDGYILLQCPNCGTFFKATPSDIEDDGVLELLSKLWPCRRRLHYRGCIRVGYGNGAKQGDGHDPRRI